LRMKPKSRYLFMLVHEIVTVDMISCVTIFGKNRGRPAANVKFLE